MKEFFEKLDKEKVFAGVFGLIAIVAILCEMKLGSFDTPSVAGGVKDIAGIALDVIMLFVALSVFKPNIKPKKLAQILEESVEKWGKANAPMIFKAENFECAKDQKYTHGFVLLQDPRKYLTLLDVTENSQKWHTYANYNSKQTGKFMDLPPYEQMVSRSFTVMFVLEQKHFAEKEGIKETIGNLIDAIKAHVDEEKVKIERIGNSNKFTLEFISAINSKKEIEYFISVIDFVLSLVKVIA